MPFSHAVIVYSSPAGTTRRIAHAMRDQCRELGTATREVDLGARPDLDALLATIHRAPQDLCLIIGSPVYASHAVPPVMDFIARLPEGSGIPAVPFVTWGGACSGMALLEMGQALAAKGLVPVGAAKILAVHSMMWRSADPIGEGHPDAEDQRLVKDLVKRLHEQIDRDALSAIPLDPLCPYSEERRAEMAKTTLAKAAAHMPAREVVEDRCTACGLCAEGCPTDAITLDPLPVFGESCIYCYRCVRECPEEALRADLSVVEERIRERARTFDEQPLSQVFYVSDEADV